MSTVMLRSLRRLDNLLRYQTVKNCRLHGTTTVVGDLLLLRHRGLFQEIFPHTRESELRSLLKSSCSIYCGFDPTADSLHVGHLITLMTLLHAKNAGHQPIAVIGGATAKIGDPSGKTRERKALDQHVIEKNSQRIQQCMQRIFKNHQDYHSNKNKNTHDIRIKNNSEWYRDKNIIDFLTGTGRNFRMGTMLLRQSVQNRLASKEGMSLTEFTYQVFQSYDWLHLYQNYDCALQIGGNDQMGNIRAGYELVTRVTGKEVYGITVPLVTNKDGDKIGKTDGNPVWLESDKTSPYELYQYFLRKNDDEVELLLKMLTFFSLDEIQDIMDKHKVKPELQTAQKKLAEEVTKLVHGETGLNLAHRVTEIFYGENPSETLKNLCDEEFELIFKNNDNVNLQLETDMTVLDCVLKAGCFKREVDAIRIIKQGGIAFNQEKCRDPAEKLQNGKHVLKTGYSLIRKGKHHFTVVKW